MLPSGPTLRLELLGGMRATVDDGTPVELPRTQANAVLAYVALNPRRSHSREQPDINALRLSSDGKRVALIGAPPEVEIWNVETGLLERTLKDNGRVYEAMFSADGTKLVCAGYNFDILVWDTRTWKIERRLPLRTFSREPIAVSRDGSRIAAVDSDGAVLLWSGASAEPAKKLTRAPGRIQSLNFSADDKSLYASDCEDRSDVPTGSPGYVCWNVQTGLVTANRSPWRRNDFDGPGYGVVSLDGRFAAFRGLPTASGSIAVYAVPAAK